MRSIGMTVAQHQKLGIDLKAAERAILDTAIRHQYGKSSKEAKALWKAMRALGDARCVMDDAVCREHPTLTDHEIIAIYYGKDSVAVFP